LLLPDAANQLLIPTNHYSEYTKSFYRNPAFRKELEDNIRLLSGKDLENRLNDSLDQVIAAYGDKAMIALQGYAEHLNLSCAKQQFREITTLKDTIVVDICRIFKARADSARALIRKLEKIDSAKTQKDRDAIIKTPRDLFAEQILSPVLASIIRDYRL